MKNLISILINKAGLDILNKPAVAILLSEMNETQLNFLLTGVEPSWEEKFQKRTKDKTLHKIVSAEYSVLSNRTKITCEVVKTMYFTSEENKNRWQNEKHVRYKNEEETEEYSIKGTRIETDFYYI